MTAAVVETHTSTLFFVDDLVYKRKRPLDLGFLDFRTLAARQAACRAEVALNARLAPDVYLGVAEVQGPDGAPCDALVVMRRMPDDRRLAALVTAGRDVTAALTDVAHQVAALHARSPAPAHLQQLGTAGRLQALWEEGLDALVGAEDVVPEQVRERTRDLVRRWLAGRAGLLAGRVAAGRVTDGHGDLLADDVFVLDDGPRVLDCLEFDERLRVGDGLADAAFLAMDLERLGAPAAARAFLDAYEAAADDDAPAGLEDVLVGYRAQVRCKVATIRSRQTGDPAAVAQARLLADLALAHLERARVRLVVVGGLPGTGKSTVAAGLAAAAGWRHVSTDVTRKRLAGLPPESPAPAAAYSAESTARTYAAVLAEARQCLQAGQSVVLDGSFVDAAQRAAARQLAADTAADLVELRCDVDATVARERITSRTGSASDATPVVRDALAATEAPWPEAVALGTGTPLEQTLATAARLVGLTAEARLLPARATAGPVERPGGAGSG